MEPPNDSREAADHLRNHLTDGYWHDHCPYCIRRRRLGGTGLEANDVE